MSAPLQIDRLSVEEKAAQLVIARLGSNMPPPVSVEEDAERVEALLRRFPIGGLIVFNGDAVRTPHVLTDLQRSARYPLLVCTDMEAGVGQQFAGATTFPHAFAFSRMGPAAFSELEAASRIAAREALACGVHIALAPVADVHRNRSNPIISIRAMSDDPEQAGALASSYVRSLQKEGLLSTAKHFPGHGGTSEDSHATLPLIREDRATLEQTDLLPFRRCIEAGVDVVMTAHVAFSALDPEARPATLSAPVLRTLLRNELGFKGLIMSDSMMMTGVRKGVAAPNAALIRAGADVVLDPVDAEEAVKEITAAVKAGEISERDLDESVRRVDVLRQQVAGRFGPAVFTDFQQQFAQIQPGCAEHIEVAERAAARAISASPAAEEFVRDLRTRQHEAAIAIMPSRRSEAFADIIVREIREHAPAAKLVEIGPDLNEMNTIEEALSGVSLVVFVLLVRPAAWHAYGLSDFQTQVVRRRMAQGNVLLAALGSPDLLGAFPEAAATLCAHSDMPPTQRAVARYLFGPTSI